MGVVVHGAPVLLSYRSIGYLESACRYQTIFRCYLLCFQTNWPISLMPTGPTSQLFFGDVLTPAKYLSNLILAITKFATVEFKDYNFETALTTSSFSFNIDEIWYGNILGGKSNIE